MNNELQKLTDRINRLKEQNEQWLKQKKLSDLPYKTQINYCRNNKKLGSLSYKAYLLLKKKQPNKAAHYFYLSYSLRCKEAVDEMRSARGKTPESMTKITQIPDDSKEDLYLKKTSLSLFYLQNIKRF